jgi:trimethylamine--corrinoid protein Co-methyltransferase
MACVLPYDELPVSQDLHEFELMVRNTTKPMVAMAYRGGHAAKIAEMASIIVGGDDELRRKPIAALYAEPVSPLVFDNDATRNFLDFAERGLPTIFLGSPNGGVTAPVTLAGLLALNNAETLAGMVLGQITRPGTPMVYGGGTSVMDLQTGEPAVGSPELCLTASASAQLARFYGMPSWGHAGLSDSRDVDAQAVAEAEFSIMTTAFSGQNLIHDLGFMETTLSYSPELLVICNEVVGKLARFVRGIEVNNETIALDVIERVGIGNSFLSDRHTLAHAESEIFLPKLAVHIPHNKYVKDGEIGMMKRAQTQVTDILATHQPRELDPKIKSDLGRIIEEVEKAQA